MWSVPPTTRQERVLNRPSPPQTEQQVTDASESRARDEATETIQRAEAKKGQQHLQEVGLAKKTVNAVYHGLLRDRGRVELAHLGAKPGDKRCGTQGRALARHLEKSTDAFMEHHFLSPRNTHLPWATAAAAEAGGVAATGTQHPQARRGASEVDAAVEGTGAVGKSAPSTLRRAKQSAVVTAREGHSWVSPQRGETLTAAVIPPGFPPPYAASGFASPRHWAEVSIREVAMAALGTTQLPFQYSQTTTHPVAPLDSASGGAADARCHSAIPPTHPPHLLTAAAAYILDQLLEESTATQAAWRSLLRDVFLASVFAPRPWRSLPSVLDVAPSPHLEGLDQPAPQDSGLASGKGDAAWSSTFTDGLSFNTCQTWADECQHLEHTNSQLQQQVEGLLSTVARQRRHMDVIYNRMLQENVRACFHAWRIQVKYESRLREVAQSSAAGKQRSRLQVTAFCTWRRRMWWRQKRRMELQLADERIAWQTERSTLTSHSEELERQLGMEKNNNRELITRAQQMRVHMIETQVNQLKVMQGEIQNRNDLLLAARKMCRRWERVAKSWRAVPHVRRVDEVFLGASAGATQPSGDMGSLTTTDSIATRTTYEFPRRIGVTPFLVKLGVRLTSYNDQLASLLTVLMDMLSEQTTGYGASSAPTAQVRPSPVRAITPGSSAVGLPGAATVPTLLDEQQLAVAALKLKTRRKLQQMLLHWMNTIMARWEALRRSEVKNASSVSCATFSVKDRGYTSSGSQCAEALRLDSHGEEEHHVPAWTPLLALWKVEFKKEGDVGDTSRGDKHQERARRAHERRRAAGRVGKDDGPPGSVLSLTALANFARVLMAPPLVVVTSSRLAGTTEALCPEVGYETHMLDTSVSVGSTSLATDPCGSHSLLSGGRKTNVAKFGGRWKRRCGGKASHVTIASEACHRAVRDALIHFSRGGVKQLLLEQASPALFAFLTPAGLASSVVTASPPSTHDRRFYFKESSAMNLLWLLTTLFVGYATTEVDEMPCGTKEPTSPAASRCTAAGEGKCTFLGQALSRVACYLQQHDFPPAPTTCGEQRGARGVSLYEDRPEVLVRPDTVVRKNAGSLGKHRPAQSRTLRVARGTLPSGSVQAGAPVTAIEPVLVAHAVAGALRPQRRPLIEVGLQPKRMIAGFRTIGTRLPRGRMTGSNEAAPKEGSLGTRAESEVGSMVLRRRDSIDSLLRQRPAEWHDDGIECDSESDLEQFLGRAYVTSYAAAAAARSPAPLDPLEDCTGTSQQQVSRKKKGGRSPPGQAQGPRRLVERLDEDDVSTVGDTNRSGECDTDGEEACSSKSDYASSDEDDDYTDDYDDFDDDDDDDADDDDFDEEETEGDEGLVSSPLPGDGIALAGAGRSAKDLFGASHDADIARASVPHFMSTMKLGEPVSRSTISMASSGAPSNARSSLGNYGCAIMSKSCEQRGASVTGRCTPTLTRLAPQHQHVPRHLVASRIVLRDDPPALPNVNGVLAPLDITQTVHVLRMCRENDEQWRVLAVVVSSLVLRLRVLEDAAEDGDRVADLAAEERSRVRVRTTSESKGATKSSSTPGSSPVSKSAESCSWALPKAAAGAASQMQPPWQTYSRPPEVGGCPTRPRQQGDSAAWQVRSDPIDVVTATLFPLTAAADHASFLPQVPRSMSPSFQSLSQTAPSPIRSELVVPKPLGTATRPGKSCTSVSTTAEVTKLRWAKRISRKSLSRD